jgi:hypothetical protein
MSRWLPLVLAGLAAGAAAVVITLQVTSGAQPWSMLLTDNFVLARSIPFTLALGAAFGASRRNRSATARVQWLALAAVLVGLVTGILQLLKGLVGLPARVDMPLVYRAHYLAATLLLFAAGLFVTSRSVREWKPDLRGAAWAALLLLVAVTGVLKAMRYIYPVPGDLLWWVSAAHVAGMVGLLVALLDYLRSLRAWAIPGALWGLGNLYVGYLLVTSGVAARNAHHGLAVQAALVLGGLLVGLFAVLLLRQAVSVARHRAPA